ncbi:putative disease resistance protein At3g14460, partial [Phalaenopsis equestris]|uniref:putative disease resistance protein At3g14460 n=1 Tax=Phalaenopsis equestris TaxID=78828 RepID=UPI0009E5749A
MGKTTLLQNIFADDITKEFDLKIWVCVSHNFEVEKVITDMLKYLDEWSSHLTILPPLQERLNSVTRSKKFLLVLDDIWEENTTKWEKVISPLANGKLGSKILVTTRINAAASMIPDIIIENKETLTLTGLEEAQCLELLKTHAFAGMENFSSEHKKLMSIAEEIVKKLSGSPLATKVIGGVLKYDLTPEHWQRISNSDIGRVELVLDLNTNPIMPILRFSFTYLPQSLQICFAFCGIFPQDHKFDKDDLVRMWIALGFIQESSIEGETLEDIGGSEIRGPDFYEISEAWRRIRLLFIQCPRQKKMSEAFENLKHLRYLNLTANLTQMPRSLSSFFHLRFIIYEECSLESCSDNFLPDNVSNLTNLRHLGLPRNVFSSVPGIGKLRSLQELSEFNVKNENGYRIGELKEMSELRKLKINGLENVNDAAEARDAKLCEKKKLTDLFLKWKSDMRDGSLQNIVNSDLDVNVLENLKPYRNLKRLSIVSYKGISGAKWMYDARLISNLEHISLA